MPVVEKPVLDPEPEHLPPAKRQKQLSVEEPEQEEQAAVESVKHYFLDFL